MNIRNSVLAIGALFGIFETVDIPHTGVPALVFALLFFALAAWIWRRDSRIAASLLGVLLAVEATQAQTWKGVSPAAKDVAMVAGSIGLALVGAYVLGRGAKATVPLVVAAALAAALTGTAAAATQARTLQFLSIQQSATFTPNGPPVAGSRIVFADAIYNRVPQFGKPIGARVGHVEGVCTIVTPQQALCTITAHVPNGQLVVAGGMRLTQGPATNHFAILGGAGAYGGAAGTVVSKDLSQTKSLVTLKLGA